MAGTQTRRLESETVYYRPLFNRNLEGDHLVEARQLSYKELIATEKRRLLTKGERARMVELEKFLRKHNRII